MGRKEKRHSKESRDEKMQEQAKAGYESPQAPHHKAQVEPKAKSRNRDYSVAEAKNEAHKHQSKAEVEKAIVAEAKELASGKRPGVQLLFALAKRHDSL